MTHREGVFLRTSKTGSSQHRLRKALRLSRIETVLALALYVSAGFLIALAHPPLLLIIITIVQGTVYLCSPIAALWNLRAQRVPAEEFRRRFEEQHLRRQGRRRPSYATAAFGGAMLLAVVTGAGIAMISSPDKLIPVPAITVAPPLVPTVAAAQESVGTVPPCCTGGRSQSAPHQHPAFATVAPTSRQSDESFHKK